MLLICLKSPLIQILVQQIKGQLGHIFTAGNALIGLTSSVKPGTFQCFERACSGPEALVAHEGSVSQNRLENPHNPGSLKSADQCCASSTSSRMSILLTVDFFLPVNRDQICQWRSFCIVEMTKLWTRASGGPRILFLHGSVSPQQGVHCYGR